jgi:hypothetical protein
MLISIKTYPDVYALMDLVIGSRDPDTGADTDANTDTDVDTDTSSDMDTDTGVDTDPLLEINRN